MKHSSVELGPFQQLSFGVPSAVSEPADAKKLSREIALLQGLETGYTAPSTLHVYYDLYGLLARQKVALFIDEKVYPVSRYGIEQLYCKKIPVYFFRHLDALQLRNMVVAKTTKSYKPIIITDGWCPQCGQAAPIAAYADIIQPYSGNIIIDDTQAFGVFGSRHQQYPYGKGGGGILQWLNVANPNIITVTSLAKAFGVPVAVISGSNKFIRAFKDNSKTIAYSSPPGLLHIRAGLNALQINAGSGDMRRQKLFERVMLMKQVLKGYRVYLAGGLFPVQSLRLTQPARGDAVFSYLENAGIKCVFTNTCEAGTRAISFVLNCDLSTDAIQKTAALINKGLMLYPQC